jgi:hypothetical protein
MNPFAEDLATAAWRKSTRSSSEGACVEVAGVNPAIAVRDSKDPDGPKLTFSRHAWQEFTADIKGARHVTGRQGSG